LALDPLAADSLLASPRLLVATIEVEIVLGLWLLSGWSMRAAWGMALAFFGILAGASLYMALLGQRSCGCFGPVAVSPWWTFALDVGAVGALALGRQSPAGDSTTGSWLIRFAKISATACALLAITGGAFVLAFDNPARMLARLRGDSITIEPAVSDVGEAEVGIVRTFTVQLTNQTDRPIRLLGGTNSCSCIATDDLPLTLSERGTGSINVTVRFVGSSGRFQHTFAFLTDDKTQRTVVARFSGQVIAPAQ
jgi:hypothetical protein